MMNCGVETKSRTKLFNMIDASLSLMTCLGQYTAAPATHPKTLRHRGVYKFVTQGSEKLSFEPFKLNTSHRDFGGPRS